VKILLNVLGRGLFFDSHCRLGLLILFSDDDNGIFFARIINSPNYVLRPFLQERYSILLKTHSEVFTDKTGDLNEYIGYIYFTISKQNMQYNKEMNFTNTGNQKGKCPSCWQPIAQAE